MRPDSSMSHVGRAACVALVGLLSLSLAAPLRAQSRAQLARGHINVEAVDVPGHDTPRAIVKAVIDAPPPKVWRIIGDCANYENTMNRVASSKLLRRDGDQHICQIEIDLPFPLSNLNAVTRATHKEGPDEWSRHWKLIRGDYEVNTGSWVLTPFDEAGTRTMVVYQIHAEPNVPLPDWIQARAQKSSLPDLIRRIRREVAVLN